MHVARGRQIVSADPLLWTAQTDKCNLSAQCHVRLTILIGR